MLETEATLRVPNASGLVSRHTDEVVAGRQEAEAAHLVLVARDGLLAGEGLQVPKLNGQVGSATCKHLPI